MIKLFVPTHFKYSNHQDERCVIVIKEFELKGHRHLSSDLLKYLTKRAKVTKETKLAKKKAITSRVDKTTSNNNVCNCQEELCSVHGVECVVCLTHYIAIESVSLHQW